jgi:hypothetical protein
VQSEETRSKISATLKEKHGGRNFRGGPFVEAVASILEPIGYIREYVVQWGRHRGEYYRLDFALIEERVNIELDGPKHFGTSESDAQRDTWLKERGWRVIRIDHGGEM